MMRYPVKYYEEFLEYIKSKYEGKYWNALPKDVSRFWASNFKIENLKGNLLDPYSMQVIIAHVITNYHPYQGS